MPDPHARRRAAPPLETDTAPAAHHRRDPTDIRQGRPTFARIDEAVELVLDAQRRPRRDEGFWSGMGLAPPGDDAPFVHWIVEVDTDELVIEVGVEWLSGHPDAERAVGTFRKLGFSANSLDLPVGERRLPADDDLHDRLVELVGAVLDRFGVDPDAELHGYPEEYVAG